MKTPSRIGRKLSMLTMFKGRNSRVAAAVALWAFCGCLLSPLAAVELQLAGLFTDGVVLQRAKPVPVWGTAAAGTVVTVSFDNIRMTSEAGADGHWRVELPPLRASVDGRVLTVRSDDGQALVVEDVLVGEVWLCSGASNMHFPVHRSEHAQRTYAQAATHPAIRWFQVVDLAAADPESNVRGKWLAAHDGSVRLFSAIGWGFAWDLYQELGVPVGIIQATVRGTRIESWLPAWVADADPAFAAAVAADEAGPRQQLRLSREATRMPHKLRAAMTKDGRRLIDPGRQPHAWNWHHLRRFDRGWQMAKLPGCWEDDGLSLDGAVWFCREFEMPPAWVGQDIMVELGRIDDQDEVWFSGVTIGKTDESDAISWLIDREYRIPAKVATAGKHTMAIRIWDAFGRGGINGSAKAMRWYPVGQPELERSLAGRWHRQVELALPESWMVNQQARQQTAVLFNGMIAPLAPFAMNGMCWYQGESNNGNPDRYAELLPALVKSWRTTFEQDDLHVTVVQLPAFGEVGGDPTAWSWAGFRDAQTSVLTLANTSLVVSIDTGDPKESEPRDKSVISERLARKALAHVYGGAVVDSGPQLRQYQVVEDTVVLAFDFAEGLTTTDGKPPQEFYVLGEGRHWKRANATIDGQSVLLWHPKVRRPIAVRYAWTGAPKVNLINAAGLPAEPFRTDR